MKKLLLILLAGIAFFYPVQGMERIKALFNPSSLTIDGRQLRNSDTCEYCNQDYEIRPEHEIKEYRPDRVFVNCAHNHGFHTKCLEIVLKNLAPLTLNNQAQEPLFCPKCHDQIDLTESKFALNIRSYMGYKMSIFNIATITSDILTFVPFYFLEKLCPKEAFIKYSYLIPHIDNVLRFYLTLYFMNKVDNFVARNGMSLVKNAMASGKLLFPITKVNIKNIAMLSASRYLVDRGLNQLDDGTGKSKVSSLAGMSCIAPYLYLAPRLIEHKNI